MVKVGLYQCKDCKTVFNGRIVRWRYDDGPWAPEPYYYDELPLSKQVCPCCKGFNVCFLGKVRVTRRMRKGLLVEPHKDKSPESNIKAWFEKLSV